MGFLNVKGKQFLITGVANKKSVAAAVARVLMENGAFPVFSVQSENHKEKVEKLFPENPIHILDVESEQSIDDFSKTVQSQGYVFSGMLHSIAFANLTGLPFHETSVKDYLQATKISGFSLVALSNALKNSFTKDASVVTISISSTKATSYGYMGPIKASLDAMVLFLAKSFSEFSNIRFNAVCSGPLKTSASAGIPDYVDNYIYAEQLTLRKKALATSEVANVACFLLSPVSSGVNGSGVLIDGGMSSNYFDQKVVKAVIEGL